MNRFVTENSRRTTADSLAKGLHFIRSEDAVARQKPAKLQSHGRRKWVFKVEAGVTASSKAVCVPLVPAHAFLAATTAS
jgi:hypothetical protein